LKAEAANTTLLPAFRPLRDYGIESDGILLSNGPGDPEIDCAKKTVQKLLGIKQSWEFAWSSTFGTLIGCNVKKLKFGTTAEPSVKDYITEDVINFSKSQLCNRQQFQRDIVITHKCK
jgi:carbamoylphosphate synthase small subunit